MKKILLATAAMIVLGGYAASADSLYIGVGQPAPAYVVEPPPPAYVVEPVPYHHYYHNPSYYDRRHYYDWKYWHDHGRHDHDHDDHDHRR